MINLKFQWGFEFWTFIDADMWFVRAHNTRGRQ